MSGVSGPFSAQITLALADLLQAPNTWTSPNTFPAIVFPGATPGSTSHALYSPDGIVLYWNGTPVDTGGGGMIYPSSGIAVSTGTAWTTSIGNGTGWLHNNGSGVYAYSTPTPANLGATTVGTAVFTLTNPSAITFLRINADNSVTALSAGDYRTALSLVPGTDIQAYNSYLTAINQALTTTSSPKFTALAVDGAAPGTAGIQFASAGATPVSTAHNLYSPDGTTLWFNGVQLDTGGTGDVVGPASATSGALAQFNGTTGKLLKQLDGTRGAVIYYGTSGWASLSAGASGYVLTAQGAGADPVWAATGSGDVVGPSVSVDSQFVQFSGTTGKLIKATGTYITAAQGGTGMTSYTVGDLLYASGATTLSALADVAAGAVLVSGGIGAAPSWSGNPTVASINVQQHVALRDNDSKYLNLESSGSLSAERTLTFNVIDGNRTLTIPGNASVSGTNTGDQTITLSGDVTGTGTGTISTTLATVPATKGGTGQTIYAVGDILYADTTTTLAKLTAGSAGTYLKSNGTGAAPTWSSPAGTGDVVGPASATDSAFVQFDGITGKLIKATGTSITAAQGGTGLTSYTIGDLIYASGTTAFSKLAAVATGKYLRSAGTGTAPVWSTLALPNAATTGDLLYADATNSISNLAAVAVGSVLISNGTGAAPGWSATPTLNTVALAGSTSGTVTLAAPAVAGTNTITFPAGTTNFGATGGTSQVVKQTSLGAAFTVAQLAASDLSNGTSGTGTVVLDSVTTTIKGGGLALTSQATYDLMYASSATQWVRIANGTTGQVLTATTSGAPAWATPSASGVTSFSAGSTGFTPNTATTGAITLAGTLGVGYGGTGLASYTIGDLLYASGTTTIAKLADVATGQVLTSGGVGAAPAYSANPAISSVVLNGSTSGTTTLKPAATAGTTTITLPAGTTDFSATGGTSQVVKQTSAGGAFTVAQLAASDLSNGTTGSGNVVLATAPTFSTSITTPVVQASSATIVTLSTNGKIKETNAAATAGVVRDLTTDGTETVYQRDGTTLGTVKSGTINDSVGSMATIRAGGLGLTSQAANDLMYASSSTQWARIPNGTTGQVLTATTGGAPAWAAAAGGGAMTLLKCNKGTTDCSGASPINLDTYAISGFTMKDQLMYVCVATDTTSPLTTTLYSTTDSVTINPVMSYNNMTAPGVGYLMTNGTDTTTIYNRRSYGSSTSFTDGGVAVTTAWTGSFTVAWRHPGGGSSSVKWQWWLYKIAGQ